VKIDAEITLKLSVSDEKEAKPERCRAIPIVGHLLDKLAAHPCVLLILREFIQR
jgi:hypothetical protein